MELKEQTGSQMLSRADAVGAEDAAPGEKCWTRVGCASVWHVATQRGACAVYVVRSA